MIRTGNIVSFGTMGNFVGRVVPSLVRELEVVVNIILFQKTNYIPEPLVLKRKESRIVTFKFRDGNRRPVDISDSIVRFVVKERKDYSSIVLEVGNDKFVKKGALGEASCRLDYEMTDIVPGTYVGEVILTLLGPELICKSVDLSFVIEESVVGR